MLLCISCSKDKFPMRLYIVLHKATNRSSDINGKEIRGFCEDGFQLAKFLNSFILSEFDSKTNE